MWSDAVSEADVEINVEVNVENKKNFRYYSA